MSKHVLQDVSIVSLHFRFNNPLGGPVEINVLFPAILALVMDGFCTQKSPLTVFRVFKLVWLACFTANLPMAFQVSTVQATLFVFLKVFWCTPFTRRLRISWRTALKVHINQEKLLWHFQRVHGCIQSPLRFDSGSQKEQHSATS